MPVLCQNAKPRPVSETQQSWVTFSLHFVAQQSYPTQLSNRDGFYSANQLCNASKSSNLRSQTGNWSKKFAQLCCVSDLALGSHQQRTRIINFVLVRALRWALSDPYYQSTCLSVCLSVILSGVLACLPTSGWSILMKLGSYDPPWLKLSALKFHPPAPSSGRTVNEKPHN